MGDQQQRQAAFRFQLRQQFEDLRLDRDVERGGGFVGDQQRGVVRQRRGDHHALTLAAGQLVRKRIETVFGVGEAGLGQHLDDAGAQGGARQPAVQRDCLRHLPANPMQRIEAGHRLLEHHAGDVAARAVQRCGAAPIICWPSSMMRPVGLVPPCGRSCSRESAVSDLPEPDSADQCQRLAAVEREGDVVHHALVAERDGEVGDFDEAHRVGLGDAATVPLVIARSEATKQSPRGGHALVRQGIASSLRSSQ